MTKNVVNDVLNANIADALAARSRKRFSSSLTRPDNLTKQCAADIERLVHVRVHLGIVIHKLTRNIAQDHAKLLRNDEERKINTLTTVKRHSSVFTESNAIASTMLVIMPTMVLPTHSAHQPHRY